MLTDDRDKVMAAQRAAKAEADAKGKEFTLEDARAAGLKILPTLPVEALDECWHGVQATPRKNPTLPDDATGVRATLSKEGEPDIRFELRRISAAEFQVLENGTAVGGYRCAVSPRQGAPALAYAGDYLPLSKAFYGCLAKKRYAGYATHDDVEVLLG